MRTEYFSPFVTMVADSIPVVDFSSGSAAGGEQGACLGGVPSVCLLPVPHVRRAAATDGAAHALLRHLLPHDGLQFGGDVLPAAAAATAQQHRGRGETATARNGETEE